jgi:hypothetical protein
MKKYQSARRASKRRPTKPNTTRGKVAPMAKGPNVAGITGPIQLTTVPAPTTVNLTKGGWIVLVTAWVLTISGVLAAWEGHLARSDWPTQLGTTAIVGAICAAVGFLWGRKATPEATGLAFLPAAFGSSLLSVLALTNILGWPVTLTGIAMALLALGSATLGGRAYARHQQGRRPTGPRSAGTSPDSNPAGNLARPIQRVDGADGL